MSKKHRKKKTESGTELSPDDRGRLDSLLADPSLLAPSNIGDRIATPQLAVSFLERVPADHASTPALVDAIQDTFPQKEVRKAARKAIFRLKQRGIEVTEKRREDSPGFFAPRAEQPSEPSAFLTPPDGLGNQLIFISIPKLPTGVDLGMGMVSDEKGVLEFAFGRYSKKKAKEMRDVFFQNVPGLIETSLAHAAAVLEAAYEKGKSGSNPSAGDYLELRPWLLDNVDLSSEPPVYDLISHDSVADAPLTDSRVDRLLSHKRMEGWITAPDEIEPLIEEILKVRQSPILVSPEQKKERILDLKEGFISKIYPEEMRKQIKSRLEETAYFFIRTGEEEYARLALMAAKSMEEKDSEFRTNDFLRHVVDHSLAYYLGNMETAQEEKAKEDSSPRIILP